MVKVGVSGFRVFEDIQEVELRPITILTGGNSSGKTSFLAAMRVLSDLSSEEGGASFNKDPFYLGSYDQIAHHRGGRFGRVKNFYLHYEGKPRPPRQRYFGMREGVPEHVRVTLEFQKRFGQAALQRVDYRSAASSLEMQYSDDWSILSVSARIADKVYQASGNASERNAPSPEILMAQPTIIGAYVENLLFQRYRQKDRPDPDFEQILTISSHFRAALSVVPEPGFVGAPVRTRPLRTYDPTDSAPRSEGSHVPGQMAQLSRTQPAEWARTREAIVAFGNDAGLFQDIEVRRLGKGDSDPFQINVVINGPKRNIVDVGYGVSQAIPIVYELTRRRKDTLYIMQQPEVHLHPEAQAALGSLICRGIKDVPGNILVETHSDFMIDRIRRHVREGMVKSVDVSLLYFARDSFRTQIHQLELSEAGEITNPPTGYREFFLREQFSNLGF